jgi:DnaJ-class molecular chaperone
MDGLTEAKKPKKIPFKCPVCNGFGTLKYGEKQCQACKGLGFVVIAQEEENA